MSWVSTAAIYFVIWWIVLFAVLPFGVRNAAESDVTVGDGHDAGAPMAPQLLKKAVVTTIVSALIYAAVSMLLSSGYLDFANMPFMPKLK
jgi:predicted secreted protein